MSLIGQLKVEVWDFTDEEIEEALANLEQAIREAELEAPFADIEENDE